MTTTTDRAPRRVSPPVLREGRMHCPRCDQRLLFDGDEYTCIACGYEFAAADLDVSYRLARRGLPARPVVVSMLALGLGAVAGATFGRLAVALGVAVTAALAAWFAALAVRTRRGAQQSAAGAHDDGSGAQLD
jgi:DNA-directed RNA polymerase subunit RPC12/RpoP